MSTDLPSQINTEIFGLTPDAQRRVLDYVRALKTSTKGTCGASLLKFAGSISAADAQLMIDAVEAGCEQVNLDEW